MTYGTDIFSAVALRPAMAALTDPEPTQAAGRTHQYGDQRLPLPGAAGTIAAAAAAAPRRRGVRRAARGWLGLYLRIAAPINRRMTPAARDHETPTDIRAMQKRWDSIITTRVGLQASATALLIVTLITS